MTRSLFYLFSFLIAGHVQGQQHGGEQCAAHEITKRFLQQQGLAQDLRSALPQPTADLRGGTLTVPVVVHVVWNTTAENVPTSAITAMINEVNQDFSTGNPDISGVRPGFASSIGNPQIQFCLAEVDPLGNPTTGITRTQTTSTWFDPDLDPDAMKSAPLGRAAWNPSAYLNIWICDITSGVSGSSMTVGYAYLPVFGVVGSNIDGIVIDTQHGLPVGSRTATHEIGHYLGLVHTWGDDPGSCTVDDGFTDTPNTDSPTYSCANTTLQKCGGLTQYENFMDYSNCQAMFSNQQGTYMRSILNGIRASLPGTTICSGPGPGGPCIPVSEVGTTDGDFINNVVLGSINNVNSGGVSQPSYTNYSATWSTSLARGSSHSISIQSGAYATDNYAVWIDYDHNGTFSPAEKLGEFITTTSYQTQNITFTVPVGATLGNTIMRVRGVYHDDGEPSPTDPCFGYTWGETEDYGITITTAGGGGPCIPTSTMGTGDGDYINSVSLNTITNLESGSISAPTYTDYSSMWSTSLSQGSSWTIFVQGGEYESDHYAVWIDYDQNGIFTADEKLGEETTTVAYGIWPINFTVPLTAIPGNTKMRVRGVYHDLGEPAPTDPCFNYTYGETEDYGIVITPFVAGIPCIPSSFYGPSEGDYINSITLQDINNLNSGGPTGHAYNDYTAQSTILVRGQTYGLGVQTGAYASDHFAAWIDHDGDGAFTIAEKLGEFISSSPNEDQVITFTVPLSAQLGPTRIRVRGVYHLAGEPTPTDPCFAYLYGETEDYTVVIELTSAVGSPDEGLAEIFPNPASDLLNIRFANTDPAIVTLFDMQGRIVLTERTMGSFAGLSIAGLVSGQYVVRIMQNGFIINHRLDVMSGE